MVQRAIFGHAAWPVRPLPMSPPDDPTLETAKALEATVGHPGDLWDELQESIQADATTKFTAVQQSWLTLMWSIDAYRIAGVPPRDMGNPKVSPADRLAAVYRTKGNWFTTLLALLLQNQTEQPIRPRTNVQGFSQVHQIDLAWPARLEDPLVCAETKVTGAPAYGSTPSRGALSDFSNRRKEIKFAATDLKLYRRQQETEIRHWGVWREGAPPKTYFLWAARLRDKTDKRREDDINKLVIEAQALVNTYIEGAGLAAWRLKADGTGYEAVPLPPSAQISSLDDVLYRIASEINALKLPTGAPPAAVVPNTIAVDTGNLAP
jgi:hypothetical protein